MFYSIYGLCPRRDMDMGGYGFSIKLWPEFRHAVALRGLTQENVNTALDNMGRSWLDACGYDRLYDPDNCGFEAEVQRRAGKLKLGPNARPAYQPNRDLHISWGEWGPEHITVPGNACGLDIQRGGFGSPRDGAALHPHNVDCWRQVQLLLVTFCWFADDLTLHMEIADTTTPR